MQMFGTFFAPPAIYHQRIGMIGKQVVNISNIARCKCMLRQHCTLVFVSSERIS